MSVALCLDPYEFVAPSATCGHPAHQGLSECPDPDDLLDVDLDCPNFRAEFPLGVVPIRHVPHPKLGMGDGFLAWAENLLAVHDALLPYDVDALSALRDEIRGFEIENGYGNVAAFNRSQSERREMIARVMRSGLTLRQIARYLDWSERDLIGALTQETRRNEAERICDADELIVEQNLSVRAAAAACGLRHHGLNTIERLRVASRSENVA